MKTPKSAKIIILDSKNNVLVLRRSHSHPFDPLAPDLPGGTIGPDEDFALGALRELREETGIVLNVADLTLIHDKKRPVHHRVLFVAKYPMSYPGIKISWEHSSFEWVPLHDLVGLETPVQRAFDDARNSIKLDAL